MGLRPEKRDHRNMRRSPLLNENNVLLRALTMVKKILILVKPQSPQRVTADEKDEREGSFCFTGFVVKLRSIFS